MQAKTKKALKRMGIAFLWLVVFAGFVVLVIAATRDKKEARCKSIAVQLTGNDNNFFLNEKDIKSVVMNNKAINPVGQLVSDINLSALEEAVAKNPWIKTADLYIDNSDVVNIRVTQREPVARIFTASGNTFYFDKELGHIPVSARYTAKVPVFTNFPTSATTLTHADSVLAAQVVAIGDYIVNDEFWMAQVSQVDITPAYQFEITPTMGDQVIVFGDGSDVEKKFEKLLAFYKQGLNKVGWGNYSRINVAFEDEVVCTRKDGGSAVKVPPPPVFNSTHADVAGDDLSDDDKSSNAHPTAPVTAAAPSEKPKPTAPKPAAAHHTPEKPKGTAPVKPKAVYHGTRHS